MDQFSFQITFGKVKDKATRFLGGSTGTHGEPVFLYILCNMNGTFARNYYNCFIPLSAPALLFIGEALSMTGFLDFTKHTLAFRHCNFHCSFHV